MGKAITPTSYRVAGNMMAKLALAADETEKWQTLFNITGASIAQETEEESITLTGYNTFGQTADAITLPGTRSVGLTSNRHNGRALAILFLGQESEITAGTENETDVFTNFDDTGAPLPDRNVDGSSVAIRGLVLTVASTTGFAVNNIITNSTTAQKVGVVAAVPDSTTLHVFLTDFIPSNGDTITNGTVSQALTQAPSDKNDLAVLTTDFTVTSTPGKIHKVAEGSMDLSNLTSIAVNYTYAKEAGSRVTIGTQSVYKGPLRLIGKNLVTGKAFDTYLRSANLRPNGDITFMSQEANARLEGNWQAALETPSGESDPGYIDIGQ